MHVLHFVDGIAEKATGFAIERQSHGWKVDHLDDDTVDRIRTFGDSVDVLDDITDHLYDLNKNGDIWLVGKAAWDLASVFGARYTGDGFVYVQVEHDGLYHLACQHSEFLMDQHTGLVRDEDRLRLYDPRENYYGFVSQRGVTGDVPWILMFWWKWGMPQPGLKATGDGGPGDVVRDTFYPGQTRIIPGPNNERRVVPLTYLVGLKP